MSAPNYGTSLSASASVTGRNGNNAQSDVTQPLLRKPEPQPLLPRMLKRLKAEVSRDWADLVLLLCYFVTGILDSSSTQAWGSFVSMQTGNTIYVGLGLGSLLYGPAESRLERSAISLASFCVGSFLFARFHRFFSPKRRWVLCVSFMAQMFLTMTAAIIVTLVPPTNDTEPTHWSILLPIAIVAFQSCGQAVTSRALKYNSLTSVVLTSIYCDLFSDKDLFASDNVERNRRAAAPTLLLLGAFVGSILSHSSFGIAGALWLAAGMKFFMIIAWFMWPAEKSLDDEA